MLRHAATLGLVPPIQVADLPFWQKVLPLGELKHWSLGAQILKPGIRSQGIHYVVSGRLRAMALASSGMQRTLWFMGPDSLIGEISMFNNSPCVFFIEAAEDSETCFFSQNLLFNTILPAHPELAPSLMRVMAAKLYWHSCDTTARSFLSAWKRVAAFLLQCHSSGQTTVNISHSVLADFLGMHRVTVTKSLMRLREEGLVELGTEVITILNANEIKKLVDE